jgi:2'-5' RNA ligase
MRLFVGIPLNETLKSNIRDAQEHMRPYILKGNFTDLNNLHLTLLFLGELNQEQLHQLDDAFKQGLRGEKAFHIQTGPLDAFLSGHERVVWQSIQKGMNELKTLSSKIRDLVTSLGIPFDEKPFKAHITIARHIRFIEPFQLHQIDIKKADNQVTQIHLYLSSRVQGRLTYTPLYTYPLG